MIFAKSVNAIMEYSKGGIGMKISKANIFAIGSALLGLAGAFLTMKSDEVNRSEMKAELKDEILNELNQERDS